MLKVFQDARSAMNQRGATAILVALLLVVLVGFTALAIDVGHLVVARNELQNAADAGALAGARFLYNEDGTAVNEGANQIAEAAATANKSENLAVEVHSGDIQRGHWSFGLGDLPRGFYANEESTDPVDLWNTSTEELDANEDFINAIRVVTSRYSTSGTPINRLCRPNRATALSRLRWTRRQTRSATPTRNTCKAR